MDQEVSVLHWGLHSNSVSNYYHCDQGLKMLTLLGVEHSLEDLQGDFPEEGA